MSEPTAPSVPPLPEQVPASDPVPPPAFEPEVDGASDQPPRSVRHSRGEGSRRTMWLIILAAVLVVAGGLTAFFLTRSTPDPVVLPDVTVTAPAPTLSVTPIAKPEGTPFFNALPATVGTFALTEIGQSPGSPGALESYQLVYSDGENTVTLLAAQYADAATATATVTGLAASATDPAVPVLVGTEQVGQMFIVPGTSDDESVIWNNQTAVFQAGGPGDQAELFYRAMPL